jgi:hypothetical protein
MAIEEDTWATNIKKEPRNDQGTPIVMIWISLSNKTDFSFEIT